MRGSRYLMFGAAAAVLAVAAMPAQGQIAATGGTETFAGITVADETLLSFPTDLANWTTVYGTSLPATEGVFSDNTVGGGSVNTAAFPAATGGQLPSNQTADVRVFKGGTAANNRQIGMKSPVVGDVPLNQTVTWTFYFAQNGHAPGGLLTQIGKYITAGVVFPEASNSLHQVGLCFLPNGTVSSGPGSTTGGDLQVHYGNLGVETGNSAYQISSTTVGTVLLNNVGAGQTDGNDYLMAQWNKVEIAITLTSGGAGSAAITYNGTLVQTVALTNTGNLRKQQLVVGIGPNATGFADFALYIDDVSVDVPTPPPPPNAVEDWMRF